MKWFKKWIEKKRWELKLKNMDFIWRLYGGYGWQLFPPLFITSIHPKKFSVKRPAYFRSWMLWS